MQDRPYRYLWWTILVLVVAAVVAVLVISFLQGPAICGDCNTHSGPMATLISTLQTTPH